MAEVWRQDDNGHQFLVAGALSDEEAEALLARLEAAGHKQFYWVVKARPDSPGNRS